jgi:imidazolonepropionase-like amidohydrolase
MKPKIFALLTLASIALAVFAVYGQTIHYDVPADALVITNGTIVDGTGADPLPDGVVVIQGNQITAVGRTGDLAISPKATVMDAEGGYILPGIINAHIHDGASTHVRRRFLEHGVTSILDLGSPRHTIAAFARENSPQGPAARGFRAGPIITVRGGYPDVEYGMHRNYEVTSPEHARLVVADLADRGVDAIKIALEPGPTSDDPWPMLSLAEVKAIVDEAHKHELLVHAHVTKPYVLDVALEAGVDVIEHLPVPFPSEENLQQFQADKGGFIVQATKYHQRMIDQGMILVPTLSAFIKGAFQKTDPTPADQLSVELYLQILRHYHDLGGIIAVANDYSACEVCGDEECPIPEMEMFLVTGLTPMEVIEASTRNGALALGQGDTLGTLEPGKLADIVVIDGNPLDDIQALRQVQFVIKDGQVAYAPE